MRPLTKHHARQFLSFFSALGLTVAVAGCSFHASAGAKSSSRASSSSSGSQSGSAKGSANASAKSSSKASAKGSSKSGSKMSASASVKASGDAKGSAGGKSKAKVVVHSKPPTKGVSCATDKKDDFKASVVLKGKGKISVKGEASGSASGGGKGDTKSDPCGLNKGDSKDCGKHLGQDKPRDRDPPGSHKAPEPEKTRDRKNPPGSHKTPEPEKTRDRKTPPGSHKAPEPEKTRDRKNPPGSHRLPPQALDPEPQAPIPPPAEPPENDFGYENPIRGCFEGLVYPLAAQTKRLPTDWSAREAVSVLYACEWDIATRSWSTGFPGVEDLFEWFAIRYTGSFAVEANGEYQFRISSDDGAKLYIDGKLVIDNDGEHPPKVMTGKINLTRGDHDMVLEYFQGPRYHINLQLYATPPGGEEGLFSVR